MSPPRSTSCSSKSKSRNSRRMSKMRKKRYRKRRRNEPYRLVPLKIRKFDPDKHCGVPTGTTEEKRPCTRAITCKYHTMPNKRLVAGRSTTDITAMIKLHIETARQVTADRRLARALQGDSSDTETESGNDESSDADEESDSSPEEEDHGNTNCTKTTTADRRTETSTNSNQSMGKPESLGLRTPETQTHEVMAPENALGDRKRPSTEMERQPKPGSSKTSGEYCAKLKDSKLILQKICGDNATPFNSKDGSQKQTNFVETCPSKPSHSKAPSERASRSRAASRDSKSNQSSENTSGKRRRSTAPSYSKASLKNTSENERNQSNHSKNSASKTRTSHNENSFNSNSNSSKNETSRSSRTGKSTSDPENGNSSKNSGNPASYLNQNTEKSNRTSQSSVEKLKNSNEHLSRLSQSRASNSRHFNTNTREASVGSHAKSINSFKHRSRSRIERSPTSQSRHTKDNSGRISRDPAAETHGCKDKSRKHIKSPSGDNRCDKERSPRTSRSRSYGSRQFRDHSCGTSKNCPTESKSCEDHLRSTRHNREHHSVHSKDRSNKANTDQVNKYSDENASKKNSLNASLVRSNTAIKQAYHSKSRQSQKPEVFDFFGPGSEATVIKAGTKRTQNYNSPTKDNKRKPAEITSRNTLETSSSSQGTKSDSVKDEPFLKSDNSHLTTTAKDVLNSSTKEIGKDHQADVSPSTCTNHSLQTYSTLESIINSCTGKVLKGITIPKSENSTGYSINTCIDSNEEPENCSPKLSNEIENVKTGFEDSDRNRERLTSSKTSNESTNISTETKWKSYQGGSKIEKMSPGNVYENFDGVSANKSKVFSPKYTSKKSHAIKKSKSKKPRSDWDTSDMYYFDMRVPDSHFLNENGMPKTPEPVYVDETKDFEQKTETKSSPPATEVKAEILETPKNEEARESSEIFATPPPSPAIPILQLQEPYPGIGNQNTGSGAVIQNSDYAPSLSPAVSTYLEFEPESTVLFEEFPVDIGLGMDVEEVEFVQTAQESFEVEDYFLEGGETVCEISSESPIPDSEYSPFQDCSSSANSPDSPNLWFQAESPDRSNDFEEIDAIEQATSNYDETVASGFAGYDVYQSRDSIENIYTNNASEHLDLPAAFGSRDFEFPISIRSPFSATTQYDSPNEPMDTHESTNCLEAMKSSLKQGIDFEMPIYELGEMEVAPEILQSLSNEFEISNESKSEVVVEIDNAFGPALSPTPDDLVSETAINFFNSNSVDDFYHDSTVQETPALSESVELPKSVSGTEDNENRIYAQIGEITEPQQVAKPSPVNQRNIESTETINEGNSDAGFTNSALPKIAVHFDETTGRVIVTSKGSTYMDATEPPECSATLSAPEELPTAGNHPEKSSFEDTRRPHATCSYMGNNPFSEAPVSSTSPWYLPILSSDMNSFSTTDGDRIAQSREHLHCIRRATEFSQIPWPNDNVTSEFSQSPKEDTVETTDNEQNLHCYDVPAKYDARFGITNANAAETGYAQMDPAELNSNFAHNIQHNDQHLIQAQSHFQYVRKLKEKALLGAGPVNKINSTSSTSENSRINQNQNWSSSLRDFKEPITTQKVVKKEFEPFSLTNGNNTGSASKSLLQILLSKPLISLPPLATPSEYEESPLSPATVRRNDLELLEMLTEHTSSMKYQGLIPKAYASKTKMEINENKNYSAHEQAQPGAVLSKLLSDSNGTNNYLCITAATPSISKPCMGQNWSGPIIAAGSSTSDSIFEHQNIRIMPAAFGKNTAGTYTQSETDVSSPTSEKTYMKQFRSRSDDIGISPHRVFLPGPNSYGLSNSGFQIQSSITVASTFNVSAACTDRIHSVDAAILSGFQHHHNLSIMPSFPSGSAKSSDWISRQAYLAGSAVPEDSGNCSAAQMMMSGDQAFNSIESEFNLTASQLLQAVLNE